MKHAGDSKFVQLHKKFCAHILYYTFFYVLLIFYFFYSVSFYSKPRYTPYILGRRDSLTSTAYKYSDIGISVGFISHVEKITIGDTRDNQIILPHARLIEGIHRQMRRY